MSKTINWVNDVEKELQEANKEVLMLIKETKEYTQSRGIKLFLTIRWCNPPCQSCPHGPYWAEGWKSGEEWKEGKLLKGRLTYKKLKGIGYLRREEMKELNRIDRRVRYLRGMKGILTGAIRRIRRISSSASQQYTKMIRNYESGNFKILAKQIAGSKYKRKGK